jgi:hypothetical protein
MKLAAFQRYILLSAEGEWGLVQPGRRTGSTYRSWKEGCEKLVEKGMLSRSSRAKGSYHITDKGRREIGVTKEDIIARTKADRLAQSLTSAKLELVECGLPKSARALDRVTKILGYEMAGRFIRS